MRIRAVTLENIKSYGSPPTRVALGEGVSAIVGPNGAGKSSLLEAIGFAVFGELGYRQEDFLRRGARRGFVTVEIESRLDGRLYHVTRRVGTQTGCEVFDPDIDTVVVSGVAPVEEFVRDHLRLDPRTDLKRLFQDSVGPAQGTFTAPFLDSPSDRKQKFDRLLQVEEYGAAYHKLSGTQASLRHRYGETETARAMRQEEAARLPEARRSAEAERAAERQLRTELAAAERQLQARVEERDAWRKRQQARDAQAEMVRQLEARAQLAAQSKGTADERLREAEEAARQVAAAAPGEQAYQEAEVELARQQRRQRERERLKGALARAEVAAQAAEGQLKLAEQELRRAEQARERRARLEPLIPNQEAAEARAQEATRRVDERTRAERERAEAERRLRRAEQAVREAEARARAANEAADRAVELAALLQRDDELRAAREQLRLDLAERQRAQQDVENLGRQEQDARAKLAEAERQLSRLDKARPYAEELPARQEAHELAVRALASASARLRHSRETRLQVEGGLCPFLAEACQNVATKNGAWTLETYFDDEIAAREREIVDLERSRDLAAKGLRDAEAAAQLLREEPFHRQQRDETAARLREALEGLVTAGATLKRLADLDARAQALAALAKELEPKLKAARDADAEARALPERQQRLDEAQQGLEQAQTDADRLRQLAAERPAAEAELAAARRHLESIGDPRGEYHALATEAAALSEREQARLVAAERLEQARAAVAEAEAALAPFADVDELLAAAEAERARHLADHERTLTYAAAAAELPARRRAAEQAAADLREAERARDEARVELAHLQAAYDEPAHRKAEAEVERLTGLRGSLASEVASAERRAAEAEAEVERLVKVEHEAAALARQAVELKGAGELCDLLRQAIRKAQPAITEQIVARISETASSLNADILGDHAVRLEWTTDYDIVVSLRGEQKSFKQLSGGEQMAAAVAVRLGLLRDLSQLDVAFLDEPTTNMDEQRRGNLARQLQGLTTFEQMVVISHDDAFDGLYGTAIRVAKEEDQTVVMVD